LKELEHYFKALADSTRLRILNLLLHGELCVCDIQHVLDVSQPTVSRHLAYLRSAGLVRDRRAGYRVFYRLADRKDGAKRRLYRFLREICAVDEGFEIDNRELRSVIKAGACTLSEWRPYSAMPRSAGKRRNAAR